MSGFVESSLRRLSFNWTSKGQSTCVLLGTLFYTTFLLLSLSLLGKTFISSKCFVSGLNSGGNVWELLSGDLGAFGGHGNKDMLFPKVQHWPSGRLQMERNATSYDAPRGHLADKAPGSLTGMVEVKLIGCGIKSPDGSIFFPWGIVYQGRCALEIHCAAPKEKRSLAFELELEITSFLSVTREFSFDFI